MNKKKNLKIFLVLLFLVILLIFFLRFFNENKKNEEINLDVGKQNDIESNLIKGFFDINPINGVIINPVTGINKGVMLPSIDILFLFTPISSSVSLKAVSNSVSPLSFEPPGKEI